MKENWKKKAVIAGAVIIVICIAVFALMSGGNSSAKKVAELLDLGNKYLTEQDYEQAVVSYREIIEIDPKCEEAYRGLADAYVAMDDYESAMDILQQGIAQTSSEELAAYLEEIKEAYARIQEEAAAREREEVGTAKSAEEQEDLVDRGAIRIVRKYPNDGTPTVCEMDAKGNIISVTYYHDYQSGSISILVEYANGHEMKTTFYNTDGTVAWEEIPGYEYEYDADGKILTASCYDENGWLVSVDEYDSNGRIVKTNYWSSEWEEESVDYYETQEYEYDEYGNEIKIIHSDNEGVVHGETVKEYDSKGRLVRSSYYYEGELMSEETYLWEYKNDAGETMTIYINEYEYFDGNLVRETFYGEAGEVLKEKIY